MGEEKSGACLEDLIFQHFPVEELDSVWVYGSAAFPQRTEQQDLAEARQTTTAKDAATNTRTSSTSSSSTSSKPPQLDLIFVTRDSSEAFHKKNVERNPHHYNILRHAPTSVLGRITRSGPGVYFNAFCQLDPVVVPSSAAETRTVDVEQGRGEGEETGGIVVESSSSDVALEANPCTSKDEIRVETESTTTTASSAAGAGAASPLMDKEVRSSIEETALQGHVKESEAPAARSTDSTTSTACSEAPASPPDDTSTVSQTSTETSLVPVENEIATVDRDLETIDELARMRLEILEREKLLERLSWEEDTDPKELLAEFRQYARKVVPPSCAGTKWNMSDMQVPVARRLGGNADADAPETTPDLSADKSGDDTPTKEQESTSQEKTSSSDVEEASSSSEDEADHEEYVRAFRVLNESTVGIIVGDADTALSSEDTSLFTARTEKGGTTTPATSSVDHVAVDDPVEKKMKRQKESSQELQTTQSTTLPSPPTPSSSSSSSSFSSSSSSSPQRPITVKYGVVEKGSLFEDLRSWQHLYLAGRAQKPLF
ncbi:unnamed protein product, partial [Amoebophrya sp. A25]|eukprot:GSA25T00012492001.1